MCVEWFTTPSEAGFLVRPVCCVYFCGFGLSTGTDSPTTLRGPKSFEPIMDGRDEMLASHAIGVESD